MRKSAETIKRLRQLQARKPKPKEPAPSDERWCPRCRDQKGIKSRILHGRYRSWFRCCGWPAGGYVHQGKSLYTFAGDAP